MSDTEDARRYRLITQLAELPAAALAEIEDLVLHLRGTRPTMCHLAPPTPAAKVDWPHAPPHRLSPDGTYFVTASTYRKLHYFRGRERLDYLHEQLLRSAAENGWQLEAWAVFSNHYHFVAHAHEGADDLGEVLRRLHRATAIRVNELDGTPGRQVWHNFRDTTLTLEASYLARLAYVHANAVKHGVAARARDYPWCSAAWYERTATPAQVATLARFKTDRVNVEDDFEPVI